MEISLPIFFPEKFDNSVIETFQRCPRKALMQYFLRRAPAGVNYAIGFGLAYHAYREHIERLLREQGLAEITDPIHEEAYRIALEESGFEEPPLGHRKDWMTKERLRQTCDLARQRISHELREGAVKVQRYEDSFELPLPPDLNYLISGERYGGRMDQGISWRNRIWVRDFKTTSRMGKTYHKRFDPNNQFSGYIWGMGELSGREIEGAIVEVVYNTKTQGPEIHQFLVTRTPGQLNQWLHTTGRSIKWIRECIEDTPTLGYLAWPQFTLACDDYGGCFYRDCCSKGGHSGEIEAWLLDRTVESEWDFTDPKKEVGITD